MVAMDEATDAVITFSEIQNLKRTQPQNNETLLLSRNPMRHAFYRFWTKKLLGCLGLFLSTMASEIIPSEPQEQLPFLENACDATRMLSKRRTLFDIKERFAAEKAKYDEHCKILEEKEAELTKRDLEFQAKVRVGASGFYRTSAEQPVRPEKIVPSD